MSRTYLPVPRSSIPDDVRFDVPPQNQGQIVEVAYGDIGSASSACRGARYKRVHDQSLGPAAIEYFELLAEPDPESAPLLEIRLTDALAIANAARHPDTVPAVVAKVLAAEVERLAAFVARRALMVK